MPNPDDGTQDPEDPNSEDPAEVPAGPVGHMPDVADGDQTTRAWIETGLFADQARLDKRAAANVPRTLAALVRNFGDAFIADCSRAYDEWRRVNPARTDRRRRHDEAVRRWVRKEAERRRARGESVGGSSGMRIGGVGATAVPMDEGVRRLEREMGR
jgi:hypothetical protein